MLCDPRSFYPTKVDDEIFFQDVDLNHLDIMNYYNELIAQGKYDDASAYINSQSGIFGYFACFFNLIENRTYALQQYLLSLPPKESPFVTSDNADDDSQITSDTNYIVWI